MDQDRGFVSTLGVVDKDLEQGDVNTPSTPHRIAILFEEQVIHMC